MPDTDNTIVDPSQVKAAKVAAHIAALHAALATPPQDSRSPWSCTTSRMKRGVEGPVQDPGMAARRQWSGLEELAAWLRQESKIGPKHEQACMHAGIAEWPGDTHKTNCAGVQCLIWDLDGAVKTAEEYARWENWLESKGCHVRLSSASHDPAAGDWRPKAVMLLDTTVTYDEAAYIAHELRYELAPVLDISPTATRIMGGKKKLVIDILIDPVVERSMQVELVPAWRDEARRAQAIMPHVHHGPSLRCAPYLERMRAAHEVELERQAALEEAKRSSSESGSNIEVDVTATPLDHRRCRAADLLRRHGPAVEGAGGHDHTWGAVLIGVRCGLSAEEFWPLFCVWNSACTPPWPEYQLRRRLEDGYRATTATPGSALAPVDELTDLLGELGGLAEFDLGGEVVAVDAAANTDPTDLSVREDGEVADGIFPDDWVIREPYRRQDHRSPDTAWQPLVTEVCVAQLPEVTLADLCARVTYRRSTYGTSKNRSLERMVRELAGDPQKRVVCVVHRRSLARRIAAAWGLPVYLDSNESTLRGSCVVCIDSAPRLAEGPVDLLIVDESEQVVRHMMQGPMRRARRTGEAWSALRDLASRSARQIWQDADLGGLTIRCVRSLLGWKKAEQRDEHTMVNTWAPPRPDVHAYKDEAGWRENLFIGLEDPDEQRGDWIACLSAAAASKLAEMIRARNPGLAVLEVHKDTARDPEVRACFSDPVRFSRYRVVVCSPSCGTGVSVEHQGRWRVWLHAQSGAGPTAQDALQAIHRVRAPVGAYRVWAGGHASRGPTTRIECKAAMVRRTKVSIARMAQLTTWTCDYSKPEPELRPDNKDLIDLDAAVEAQTNLWGGCLGDREIRDEDGNLLAVEEGTLTRAFAKIGCDILRIGAVAVDPKAAKAEAKAAKEAVDERRVEEIVAAAEQPLALAEVAAGLEDSSPEAAAELEQARIREVYGIDHGVPIDPELVRRDDRGRYRPKIRQLARVRRWQAGEHLLVIRQDRRDVDTGHSIDLRHRASCTETICDVLEVFGLGDLVGAARALRKVVDPGVGAISPGLEDRLELDLGIRWDSKKSTPMRLLGTILRRIGLELRTKQVRIAGTRGRAAEYRVDLLQLEQAVADSETYFLKMKPPVIPMGEFDLEETVANLLAA